MFIYDSHFRKWVWGDNWGCDWDSTDDDNTKDDQNNNYNNNHNDDQSNQGRISQPNRCFTWNSWGWRCHIGEEKVFIDSRCKWADKKILELSWKVVLLLLSIHKRQNSVLHFRSRPSGTGNCLFRRRITRHSATPLVFQLRLHSNNGISNNSPTK